MSWQPSSRANPTPASIWSLIQSRSLSAFILAISQDGVLSSTPEDIAADEIAAACCVLLKGEFR